MEYGRKEAVPPDTKGPPVEKQKPDFGLSGKLSEEQRTTVDGIVLKFVEPPEAKKPTKKWKLYPFKGDEALGILVGTTIFNFFFFFFCRANFDLSSKRIFVWQRPNGIMTCTN